MALMEEIPPKTLPPGHRLRVDGDVLSGEGGRRANLPWLFALANAAGVLVAGRQYESWYAPMSVNISGGQLSLLGPLAVLTGLRIKQSHTRSGWILLDRRCRQNAILIVEVALELLCATASAAGVGSGGSARAVSPILHDVVRLHPRRGTLVLATGAGANARKSIGITVFSGMLASTCLAVLSCRRSLSWCSGLRTGLRSGGPKATGARHGWRSIVFHRHCEERSDEAISSFA